jgi:predicted transposase YbfD/YdcC
MRPCGRILSQPLDSFQGAGSIITIDAMGTQKAIAQQIIDGGGDLIMKRRSCAWSIDFLLQVLCGKTS